MMVGMGTIRQSNRPPREKPARIGLLALSFGGMDAEIFRGVNRYARPHRRWWIATASDDEAGLELLLALNLKGIIGHINHARIAARLKRRRIPTVNLSGLYPDAGFPLVRPDDPAVGRLAAQHLLERGFRTVAFFGGATPYERQREDGFVQAASSAGATAHVYRREKTVAVARARTNPELEEQRRIHWVRALPKPVGILAAHDRLALQLLDICHSLGLDVPGQVAIVGVDDEEIVCESSWPTISSVRLQGERMGFEAARVLERLMRRAAAPLRPVLLPPVGVTTRQSSDAVAVKNPLIARAMRYIRDHAAKGINVTDVVRSLPVNRRTFERQFRDAVGRSPLDELLRVRLDHARRLLAATDLQMPQVAEAAGFRDASHLWEVFRRLAGLSPRDYRARFRSGNNAGRTQSDGG
jgi:LacI family transcriptional regulator